MSDPRPTPPTVSGNATMGPLTNMTGVHCERFPTCMVLGVGSSIPICEETECPGRIRQNIARTIADGLLEPRTKAEIRAAIDGVLLLKEEREKTIEECARAIEDKFLEDDPNFIKAIAAAIRALKDKP